MSATMSTSPQIARPATPDTTPTARTASSPVGVADAVGGLPHRIRRLVADDLYKDIHKGIRAELFALTATAGSLDPADGCGRIALADHVAAVAAVLESHARHEDDVVDPALRAHLPDLAERVTADHDALAPRFGAIVELAGGFTTVHAGDQRLLAHQLYLDLGLFTGAYLAHQDLEEREVMPALDAAVGVDAVVGMHIAIVGSIEPAEMARSLAFMLPAMNVDDRTELLGGMREAAPPEAFAAVIGLAASVLDPSDHAALAARLGIG